MLLRHARQAGLTVRRLPGRSSAGSHGKSLSGPNSRKLRRSNQNNRSSSSSISSSNISNPGRVSRNPSSKVSSRVSRNPSSHLSSNLRDNLSKGNPRGSLSRDSSSRDNLSRDSSSRDSSRGRHGNSSGSRTGTGARDSGTTCLISADLIMSAGRRTNASAPSSSNSNNSRNHPSSLTGFYLPVNL